MNNPFEKSIDSRTQLLGAHMGLANTFSNAAQAWGNAGNDELSRKLWAKAAGFYQMVAEHLEQDLDTRKGEQESPFVISDPATLEAIREGRNRQ